MTPADGFMTTWTGSCLTLHMMNSTTASSTSNNTIYKFMTIYLTCQWRSLFQLQFLIPVTLPLKSPQVCHKRYHMIYHWSTSLSPKFLSQCLSKQQDLKFSVFIPTWHVSRGSFLISRLWFQCLSQWWLFKFSNQHYHQNFYCRGLSKFHTMITVTLRVMLPQTSHINHHLTYHFRSLPQFQLLNPVNLPVINPKVFHKIINYHDTRGAYLGYKFWTQRFYHCWDLKLSNQHPQLKLYQSSLYHTQLLIQVTTAVLIPKVYHLISFLTFSWRILSQLQILTLVILPVIIPHYYHLHLYLSCHQRRLSQVQSLTKITLPAMTPQTLHH